MNEINQQRSVIIISASSDIGAAMARRWKSRGWNVTGTYRTSSATVKELEGLGIPLVYCDLANTASIDEACAHFGKLFSRWDVLVIASGTQEPVGAFMDCDFNEWEKSINANFIKQMRIIHKLLPFRRLGEKIGPGVLLFAGGGTNNATVNYSAYTISKIASIKMCELLDAEIPDTRFVIVGPGWVKTKIHEATLKAGAKRSGVNYQKTILKLAGNECIPMDEVLACCDWVLGAPRALVGGRNFSTVFDKWGSEDLNVELARDPNMYKLRRLGNDRLVKTKYL